MGQFRKMLRKLNFLRKIQSIYALSKYVDIPKTLYWNFKLFPWEIAIKIPLYLGYNSDIRCERGAVKLQSQVLYPGMVMYGISKYPTLPSKGVPTLLRIGKGSSVTFGQKVNIAKGCSIVATFGGQVEIGNDVFINQGTIMYCNSQICVGNHVSFGWNCQVYDSSVHYMIDLETGAVRDVKKPIFIGDNVWVANKVTIASGAEIPSFTTVAALSLVNKDFTKNPFIGGLLVGMPAVYKDIKKVRLLNDAIESNLKANYFKGNTRLVNLEELSLSPYPLGGEKNKLYHS